MSKLLSKLSRQQFITKIASYAIADMQKTKIPASLTIAQGILESANGNSSLTVEGNNLFGIKGTGTAGSVRMATKEFVNNEWIIIRTDFRKYNNWGESVEDHSKLFINGVSWNPKLYHGVIGKDGITAAKEVAKAGYATDPKYADKLINLIKENNLQQYDNKIVEPEKPEEPNYDNRIIELEEVVNKIIVGLTKVSDKLVEIDAPEWFVKEFPESIDLINQKTGTLDFWRTFAVVLRILKNKTKLF